MYVCPFIIRSSIRYLQINERTKLHETALFKITPHAKKV